MTGPDVTSVVIVGAGQAGAQTALSLRELGYSGSIALIGNEPALPYQRPPLSKGYLLGQLDEDDLLLRTAEVFADQQIDVLTDAEVVAAQAPTTTGGGRVDLADGRSLSADAIVLATGAAARAMPISGAELPGVCLLRTMADAQTLGLALQSASRVVIVGGGFIGLEAAAVCRQRGLEVTVVEAAHRLCARALTAPLSDHLFARHRAMGAQILLGTTVTRFLPATGPGANRVGGVELNNGEVLPADLVVVGVGASPRIELAELLGAECREGIVVDSGCRTSLPGVLAVGDCTEGGHLAAPPGTRLESVHNAVEQAKVAAAVLTGQQGAAYSVPPFFWSDQGDLKIQLVGLTADVDRLVVRGEVGGDRFSVLAYRAGRLVGADCVNDPHDFMAARRALNQGRTIDPDRAAAGEALKGCIVD